MNNFNLKSNDSLNKEKKHYYQINYKKLKLQSIKLDENQFQLLGEALENWCNLQYKLHALTTFYNCKWYKDTAFENVASLDSKYKTNYIFEIYIDDKKFISVYCMITSKLENGIKNSYFYNILNKEKIKNKCQYALLISELEYDSIIDIPIRKVSKYINMYIVRPNYFITFLSLLYSLTNKYKELILYKKRNDKERFKDFEIFKKNYLDYSLKEMEAKVMKIKKESHISQNSLSKSIDLANQIFLKYIFNENYFLLYYPLETLVL